MIILFSINHLQGQVVISLVFGDKLNSEKLKFGLDGGLNFSSISNVGPSKYRTGFNLGFYFDFLLKENTRWYIHTGVLVKSAFGVDGLDPYPIGDTEVDSIFSDGTVNRKLSYFSVPGLVRYRFKNHVFIELGPMLGLLHKAEDTFYADIKESQDLSYRNNIKDQYNRIDVGVMGGIGYHLMAGYGMNVGIRYYQGLRNLPKQASENSQLNSNIYLFVSIPIGASPEAKQKNIDAAKERADKKAHKKQEKEEKKQKKSENN